MARNIIDKLSKQKSCFYYYHVNSTAFSNLSVYDCGYEKYSNAKKTVTDYYPYFLMHCVLTGRGFLNLDGETHTMCAGDIFIIPPEYYVEYYQDVADPWSYAYVNFSGVTAISFYNEAGFSPKEPKYQYKNKKMQDTFTELVNCETNQRHTLKIYSVLFKIMADIVEERHVGKRELVQSKSYIADAIAYIEKNYQNSEISLESVSNMLHLNPSYFSRVFHSMTGSTFVKHLTLFRIKKASDLLTHSDLPINEIANSVGYEDALYFAGVFKKYRLMTPSEYKAKHRKS